jgi:hypothetical protein
VIIRTTSAFVEMEWELLFIGERDGGLDGPDFKEAFTARSTVCIITLDLL